MASADTEEGTLANELLANCWMHSTGTTPFRGAHGYREWSSENIEKRAEKLSEAGFSAIGIYIVDLEHMLEDENRTLEELRELFDSNGIETVELEFLVSWLLDEDDYRRQEEKEARQLLLDAAEVLDARHIKIGNIDGYPRSTDELAETFEDICDEFAEVDTDVGFEAMPADPNVDDLNDALAFIEEPDNGGLYVDLWHMVKMGISNDEIRSLSADDITAVEFQDGYIGTDMGFLEETVNLRKIPGEGEFDIEGFVDALRDTGYDGPLGLEILSEEFRRMSMNDAYNRAYDAGASYL